MSISLWGVRTKRKPPLRMYGTQKLQSGIVPCSPRAADWMASSFRPIFASVLGGCFGAVRRLFWSAARYLIFACVRCRVRFYAVKMLVRCTVCTNGIRNLPVNRLDYESAALIFRKFDASLLVLDELAKCRTLDKSLAISRVANLVDGPICSSPRSLTAGT
jgi:hypothetical protein